MNAFLFQGDLQIPWSLVFQRLALATTYLSCPNLQIIELYPQQFRAFWFSYANLSRNCQISPFCCCGMYTWIFTTVMNSLMCAFWDCERMQYTMQLRNNFPGMNYPARTKSDTQQQWLQSLFLLRFIKMAWPHHRQTWVNPSIHSLHLYLFTKTQPKMLSLWHVSCFLTSLNPQTLDH